jgi:hypothetical protein
VTGVSAGWALLAVVVGLLAACAAATRMYQILQLWGVVVPLKSALRIHFESTFYMFFTPISVGMEVARFGKISYLLPETSKVDLGVALVVDRIVGMLVISILAVCMLPVIPIELLIPDMLEETLADAGTQVLLGGCLLVALLLIAALLIRVYQARLARLLKRVVPKTRHAPTNFTLGVTAISASASSAILYVLAIWVASRVFGLEIPLEVIASVTFGSILFQVIPISFLGLSATDVAGVALYILFGSNQETATLLVALAYGLRLLPALIGGGSELVNAGVLAMRRDQLT